MAPARESNLSTFCDGMTPTPFISVIICSKDRRDYLARAVKSVLESDYPREYFELIIVEETDEPCTYDGTRTISIPRRDLGLGFARKTGAAAARGEFLVFTDDDCVVEKTWFVNILAPMLSDPDTYGVSGATLVQNTGPIGVCEAIFGLPGGGYERLARAGGAIIAVNSASGCNMAFRAEVFRHIEIDDKFSGRLGSDDWVLSSEVANRWKLVYAPNAVVYHQPRNSLRGVYRLMLRRRHKGFQLVRSRIEQLRLIFNIRTGLLPRIFALLVLAALFPPGGLETAGALVLLFYCSMPFVFHKRLRAAHAGPAVWITLPIVKAVMDWAVLRTDLTHLFVNRTGNTNPVDGVLLDKYYQRH